MTIQRQQNEQKDERHEDPSRDDQRAPGLSVAFRFGEEHQVGKRCGFVGVHAPIVGGTNDNQ